jgi:hypothetical protein
MDKQENFRPGVQRWSMRARKGCTRSAADILDRDLPLRRRCRGGMPIAAKLQ